MENEYLALEAQKVPELEKAVEEFKQLVIDKELRHSAEVHKLMKRLREAEGQA